jgi:SAM-dependent methyltransferase
MTTDNTTAQNFWDREVIVPTHASWMADAAIRDYINQSIGETKPGWPFDWLEGWLGGRRLARALSIGCGTGGLERDLIKRGICSSVDAFDGSVVSLCVAHEEARRTGFGNNIQYFAMDFNEPVLPRHTYDAVFFHQSAHHVAKLEKLFRAVLLALKPGGILYLDEYVGPSRHEWMAGDLVEQEQAYQSLPEAVRSTPHVPLPIQADDPSEAFRSSEILEQLKVGFTISAMRPYGGTLLSVLYPILRHDRLTPDLVGQLIVREKQLLANGAESFYAIIVALPKRGFAKARASLTYYAVPKIKRILREIGTRLSGVGRRRSELDIQVVLPTPDDRPQQETR